MLLNKYSPHPSNKLSAATHSVNNSSNKALLFKLAGEYHSV